MSTHDTSTPGDATATATTTPGAGPGLLEGAAGGADGASGAAPSAPAPGADDAPVTDDPPAPEAPAGLAALGLTVGEKVRWRKRPGARWRYVVVVARERDGSVGVRDEQGASRALRIDRLEVATRGPRGAATWEPLAERAARQGATLFPGDPEVDGPSEGPGPPARPRP